MRKTASQSKWIFFILTLIMLAFGQSSMIFAAENSSEAASVIRVGYTGRDQMIVKSGDIFSGYGVSYLQTIAAYTGWKYEYVLVTDENRMDKLKNGNIDLLCDVSMDEAESNSLLTSAENSCMHYALLCAKEDDASVFYNEYEAMNGKRIAVNTSRKMEHMMEEFAAEHHIEYTPVYCSSFAEMDAAVQKGRADLLVAASLRKLDGYKYVAKMGMRDQFFATSQKHPVLMEQLNRADRQIKIKQPFIIASLYEKFYGRPAETLVGMTREEYEFIQKKIPIRIVCDASNFPISYVDETTGKYSGVYADALTLIEEESGLHFQFMPLKNYKDSWKLLQSGEADMSANMYLTEDLKKTYGLLSSTPYLTSNFTMILRRDQTLEGALKVALPDNYKDIQEYVSTCYPKWQIVPAKNTNACLRMVENGDVDVTILNSIFLQTTYNLSNYSNLIVLPMHSLDIPISCAFSGPNAQLLCDIINKTIKRIPPESFENCIIDNSVKISYEPTMMDITKKVFPFLVLVFAIFIIIYLWTLWSRERHYRHLAMTDSVTGLWNGMYFRQKAGEILSGNRQNSYQLISMDIEHFKHVNTDFGEKTADSILRNMAARLRSLFGSDAVCAREMGDMFLILTQPKDDVIDGLLELGREIVFDNNGIEQHYKPDLKFGLYEISADTDRLPVNEYIDRAIAARKSVKRNPARQIAHYDQKMEEAISLEARIEKKMENALRNREFSVYYQPKYLLDSEHIVGAEALVRWNDPNEGMIFPNTFIPIFERNGFIVQLDFYVYEEVLRTIAKWRSEGQKDIVVSVNVSRAHIGTSDFLSRLSALTERYDVPRRLFELELTETVLGGERQDVLDFIHNCKAAGFPISIDDFGSGYSSLNLLKDLPVDVLKIDREFLNETEVSEKSSIIIEHIVEMAAKIQINTLCEGVETQEQAAFLKKIGCDMAQGYLYSKPVPLEIFEALLDSDKNDI